MGLDYVELVLAVEDKFGIDITSEEAMDATTVGRLYQVVLSKVQLVPHGDPRCCLTTAAFYQTRLGLVEALNLQRADVRPGTRLDSIFPRARRRRLWQAVQNKIGMKMPKLRHPAWVELALFALGSVPFVILASRIPVSMRNLMALAAMGLLALVSGGILLWATRPFANGLPRGVATVGDLVREVLATNYSSLAGQQRPKEVWDALCSVIVEQLSVDREVIRPESSFLDDLRID